MAGISNPANVHTRARVCVSKNRRTGTQLEINNQEIKCPEGFGLLW